MKHSILITLCSIFALMIISPDYTMATDRTKRPAAKPAPTVELPKIQKAKLSNGLEVWLVEHKELPIAAFSLVLQVGSDHDPMAKAGLASMTADVIDEGTKTRDALRISDDLESIGAALNIGSGVDGSSMTLRTLTKHLDKALDIFSDVLVNPMFPQKEFDRLKKERLASLKQQQAQPVSIANNAYSYILYSAEHPYGNNPSGTPASIEGMSREDVSGFYDTYYRPNNATLIVVGDVSLSAITATLEKSLAAWTTKPVPPFQIPDPKPVDARRVYLVDKPGAPQSEVRIGYPALPRRTPDFFPVFVMNRMLGGQFTSRINLNLREKHGYTYGARSAFNFQKGPGPFTASGGIVTEKTDSALIEFLHEIDLMREKGMSDEEMLYVKKGLIGNFALNFETPAQIATTMQNVILYGLPEDYYSTYLQNIEKVTADDVMRVSKKYLDTSKMAVVVVGDMAKIKSGIEAAKIGESVMCGVDGKPMP